jgi:L-fuculose-phosphate aldolase
MTSDSRQNFSAAQADATAAMRAKIARFGAMLYDRRLFDAAGGNMSARVGDLVCLSPRYAGSIHQWQLKPEQVLVVDLNGNILDGGGQLSRETKVHLRLHREFGEHGTGVIHAHSRNLLVFAAMARPLPPVLEATRKFGEIPVIEYAPAHSMQLSENVAGAIRGQEARIRKQAAAAIAPWHGLFVMGKDIDAAFDAVERIDNNAYIILMAEMLKQSDLLAEQRAALEAACANFTGE